MNATLANILLRGEIFGILLSVGGGISDYFVNLARINAEPAKKNLFLFAEQEIDLLIMSSSKRHVLCTFVI